MSKICYVEKAFRGSSLDIIDQAVAICEDYAAQGFQLTLRQLYYQFVARGLLANKDTEYKRLGGIISDARLAGRIDWRHLEDRTRFIRANAHWTHPGSIISSAAAGYALSRWDDQPVYVEVWIEKDALAGVIDGVCRRNDVPYIPCRGYMSQSEMWSRAMELVYRSRGKFGRARDVLILHLGDHDPSGIDMTRDIEDRLRLFCEAHDVYGLSVKRIALTMDQIAQYNPPPNPAKLTDSRGSDYVLKYGDESWELDALSPAVLDALIQDEIDFIRDVDADDAVVNRQEEERATLRKVADQWDRVVAFINGESA